MLARKQSNKFIGVRKGFLAFVYELVHPFQALCQNCAFNKWMTSSGYQEGSQCCLMGCNPWSLQGQPQHEFHCSFRDWDMAYNVFCHISPSYEMVFHVRQKQLFLCPVFHAQNIFFNLFFNRKLRGLQMKRNLQNMKQEGFVYFCINGRT